MWFPHLVALLCVGTASLSAADFSCDIAPILLTKCLVCHSAEKAKGGYRVHTFAAVLQPGKSKDPAVVPGKPVESELFKRLVTHDEDDRMPQEDDPLPPAQIELFRAWITAGALIDRGEPQSPLALLIPRTPHPAPPEFYRRPVPILALAFTPDARQVAVSGYHEITFWNLSGELTQRVTNAPQRIHSLSFAVRDNLFALAGGKPGRNGELSVYQHGALLTNLVQTADELLTVTFSPDAQLLAAGGSDHAFRVFKNGSWEKISTVQQHADWVTSLHFNSAGTKLLSASRDRTVRLYDAESGDLETTYPGHSAPVSTAVFLDDEKIASAGREKIVHIWDTKEGKKRNEIGNAEAEINELIASDKFLFVASSDKNIRQYSTSDRKLIRTYSGNNSPVYSIAYHAETQKLASGSHDGTVKIWNAEDGTLAASFIAAPLAPITNSAASAEASR